MDPDPIPPSAWRGFNLCELFVLNNDPRWMEMTPSGRGKFFQEDFLWIADLGFNYVRIPLTYLWWGSALDPMVIREEALEPIDSAVEWAASCGLNLSINFHHVPGFCVNNGLRDDHLPSEPWDLWKHPHGAEVLAHHWKTFARRYRSKGRYLSFDILNEPCRCTRDEHERVIREAVLAIRKEDASRPIVINGFHVGGEPCPELSDLNCIQSCRGYWPGEITHHGTWWSWTKAVKPPEWPDQNSSSEGLPFTREGLRRRYSDWRDFRDKGNEVVCGELGCAATTPHAVVLDWLEDELTILNEAGIGWSLWNFRGSFGIVDSGRRDAQYNDFHGHQLDVAMLDILKNH